MIKFLSLTLLLLTLLCDLSAQSISGQIVDKKDRPIPFAHIIYTQDKGTVSNDSGYFNLVIPELNTSDSIKVSAIGRRSKSIQISSFSTEQNETKIILEQQVQILDDVIISADAGEIDTAYFLISKAIEQRFKNYPTKKFSYNAFYRETTIADTNYVRISEALATINDYGYRRNISQTRVKVTAIRKSKDMRDLSWRESLTAWLYKNNGLYHTLGNDRLKVKSKTRSKEYYENRSLDSNLESLFFNDYFLEHTTFELSKTVKSEKDTIFQIRYYPDKFFHSSKVHGIININKKDMAIVSYTSYVLYDDKATRAYHEYNNHAPQFDDCRLCQWDKNRVINDSIYYSTHVEYKKNEDDKYHLKFISTKSKSGTNGDVELKTDFAKHYNSKGKLGNFYIHNELYVTEILPFERIKSRNLLDRDEDMHDLDAFGKWETVNIPQLVPLSKKMYDDLAEGKNLFIQ